MVNFRIHNTMILSDCALHQPITHLHVVYRYLLQTSYMKLVVRISLLNLRECSILYSQSYMLNNSGIMESSSMSGFNSNSVSDIVYMLRTKDMIWIIILACIITLPSQTYSGKLWGSTRYCIGFYLLYTGITVVPLYIAYRR